MSKSKPRNANNLHSFKRNKVKLEYQRFEDRNLLASDLGMGPISNGIVDFDVTESVNRPADSLSQQLQTNDATASLERGLNGLLEVASESTGGQNTTVLQQTWNGLPVYGAFVTIVQNASGEVINHRDQTVPDILGYARDTDMITGDQAITAGTIGLGKPTLMESTVRSAWFYAGNKARLAWLVETSVSNPQGDIVGEFETWVNVFDGAIFAREAKGAAIAQQMAEPLTDVEVHPWVVINDEIGPAGARSYAAPFDAVVHISVGCTGTLIAPNAIISARHCGIGAGDSINFGDDRNNPDFSIDVASSINPGGGNAGSNLFDGGDLSLHTLVGDVPASVATPMRFVDSTDDLVGSVALWIGYGRNGVGSEGSSTTPDGFRWAAENIIDAYGAAAPIDFGSNMFTSDFDDGTAVNSSTGSQTPLEFEGMGGPGDSGGPMLVNVNGEWVIGAVVSGGTTRNSVYGTTGWWTGSAIYRSQIEEIGGEFIVDESSIGFNRDEYFVGDTIDIRLVDGNATGDISITVVSDTGDTEVVSASPISPGVYEISLESANANIVVNDGTLQVDVGDEIQLTYVDADDGDGNAVTLTDSATMKAVTASELIGVDFDVDASPGSPLNWLTVGGASNVNLSDMSNEQNDLTPVDLSVNGTWTGLDVSVNPNTIPLHPNSLANISGQIQTSGQPIQLIYSDLVASTDYLVYVMSAEGIFDSIEQTVSIQGLGSAVVFEQRFNQGDLFVNDQIGDSSRNLEEYAQLITSDINGQITISVTPIGDTQDVVISGLAIVPDTEGIDAVSDYAVTGEDQLVNINVTANDIETDGQPITLESVSTPGNGTATISDEGTVDYSPNNNFVGTDTFSYVIRDSDGNTATGNATIEVTATNDAPLGVFLSSNTVDEDANVGNDVFIGTLTGVDVDNTSHTFSLANGSGDTDNDAFVISGDSLSLKAGTNLDFDTQPVLSIRVAVSDGELTTEHVLTVEVRRNSAPVIATINNGDAQRSMVSDLVLTFDEIVVLGANPFRMTKRGADGGAVAVTPTIDNSSGQTVVTLTFSGTFVSASGSLEDGNYQLTVFGDQITGSSGALDGNNDGAPGGDFVFGDTETDNFFRFFGDGNGDRTVSAIDLLGFRRTWLEDAGEPGYDATYDFDANGVVSALDLLQFRRNYLDRLDFS